MTNQNEKAEEIMKKIESEEESLSHTDTEKQIYHSCIVNLVIGTLYCEKRNFEFGIGRICKSLEPYEKTSARYLALYQTMFFGSG